MPEAEIINEPKMLKKHLTLQQHSKHIKLSINSMEMFASWNCLFNYRLGGVLHSMVIRQFAHLILYYWGLPQTHYVLTADGSISMVEFDWDVQDVTGGLTKTASTCKKENLV